MRRPARARVLSDNVPGDYRLAYSLNELVAISPRGLQKNIVDATKGETEKEGFRIYVKVTYARYRRSRVQERGPMFVSHGRRTSVSRCSSPVSS